jgi:hypothetical protein
MREEAKEKSNKPDLSHAEQGKAWFELSKG